MHEKFKKTILYRIEYTGVGEGEGQNGILKEILSY